MPRQVRRSSRTPRVPAACPLCIPCSPRRLPPRIPRVGRNLRRGGLLVLLTVLCRPAAAADAPYYPAEIPALRKADFIFFSNAVFAEPANEKEARKRAVQIDFIRRFRICLTNGYANFAGEELDDLHAAGCEFFIYRWFNGFYVRELPAESDRGRETDFISSYPEIARMHREIHAHPDWLLNHSRPIQGGGASEPAWFFDYGNPEFRRYYVAAIQRDLAAARYDGVFFDYIGGWALPAEIKPLFNEKHPGQTYDDAGILFLRELRAAIGTQKIFGNQAYRLPEAYYDLIDYDATESHATSFVWGKEASLFLEGQGVKSVLDTFVREWDGPNGCQEIARQSRAMSAAKPRVKVCDINYLQPRRVPTGASAEVGGRRTPVFSERTDRPSIFYSYVVSKLHNAAAFASDWYCPGHGQDDVYFLDLGEPLDGDYVEHPDAVVRYFKNGFVVLTRRNGRVVFAPDAKYLPEDLQGVWDVYEGIAVHDWPVRRSVTIDPAWYPSTRSHYPSGRVYMFLRNSPAK
ncbi:MAG: hypothetical protein FJ276_01355 [Planctomycetes bacterium]|nr:hypothetical protein [Planctomycetota bacterium]